MKVKLSLLVYSYAGYVLFNKHVYLLEFSPQPVIIVIAFIKMFTYAVFINNKVIYYI